MLWCVNCRERGTSLVINKDTPPRVGDLGRCFASVTFCTRQAQRNDNRNCSTFLSLIKSWEDKQVTRCSLARAWDRAERERERERKRHVCGFFCVSAYLTNDRKIKATPVLWQQEWRAQRRAREGECNFIPSYTPMWREGNDKGMAKVNDMWM